MSDEVADLIEDGADLIEKYGHVKDAYGTPHVGFCESGALRHVLRGSADVRPEEELNALYHEALRVLAENVPPSEFPKGFFDSSVSLFRVIHYNDKPGRTVQEILDHMRLSAKKARE